MILRVFIFGFFFVSTFLFERPLDALRDGAPFNPLTALSSPSPDPPLNRGALCLFLPGTTDMSKKP